MEYFYLMFPIKITKNQIDIGDTLLIHFFIMPTNKKRLNITLTPDLEQAIKYLAKRDKVPEATKAAELIKEAIEIEEDKILLQVAEERSEKGVKYLSHEKIWKELLK
ncbi:antitoxin, RHH family protein [Candidatus Pacebacteria bacterium]|nr:antitoxin, RHH family protein [Candidatus Paceibacterota bacterium]